MERGNDMLPHLIAERRKRQAAMWWMRKGFRPPAPHFVKLVTLERHAPAGATWVESGTYRGDTARHLAMSTRLSAKRVVTMEPSEKYFEAASLELSAFQRIETIYGESTEILPKILPDMSGPICFWLDGHFSSGDTHMGASDTPIIEELAIIEQFIGEGRDMSVFVDDVRLFASQHRETDDEDRSGYPPLELLTEFVARYANYWTIEHDILIALNLRHR
jgi:hypothetical protein